MNFLNKTFKVTIYENGKLCWKHARWCERTLEEDVSYWRTSAIIYLVIIIVIASS